MSTPSGVARGHIFLLQLPNRAPPARGSFQDLVAQELYYRDRRRVIAEKVYEGQLLAAGLNIPQAILDAWTALYIDEVTQDNYKPSVAKSKHKLLDAFSTQRRVEKKLIERTDSYSIQNTKDMQPYSKAELENIKAKLRKKVLRDAQQQE